MSAGPHECSCNARRTRSGGGRRCRILFSPDKQESASNKAWACLWACCPEEASQRGFRCAGSRRTRTPSNRSNHQALTRPKLHHHCLYDAHQAAREELHGSSIIASARLFFRRRSRSTKTKTAPRGTNRSARWTIRQIDEVGS
ncbi:unnamed protein product [Amoebophrya sp. A25]|nr:unnamed protein product [Amoebophrya sp. A25]|eukprot:GSA25T00025268001.1